MPLAKDDIAGERATGFHVQSLVCQRREWPSREGAAIMETLATVVLPIAAAGYSLVYLLAGGGLGGAILIFIVAKMLGR
jgi:hypothetical protein